ncbi:MAG: heavy metal translocating P-type ATPase, partial [Ruminococcus sp.]|nr:heavy metal translocating P-type ATPase [Ruminococcus sp.]
MSKQSFDVSGMSCAACQAHVEKAVSKVEGVKDVSVSLLTNSMRVEYDGGICDDGKIISAVSGAGYGASVKSADKKAPVDVTDAADKNAKAMKKRLWLSVGFLVPLFYLCMGHMAGLPIPSIFAGHENMMIFALTQLVLTFIIAAINFHYFRNGFKALVHLAPNMDSLIALGASAAFGFSLYGTYMIAYHMGRGDMSAAHRYMMDLYYESCGMILTLIDVGKYLEARSKGKTADAVKKLVSLAPKTAIVIRDGEEQEIPAQDVTVGETIVLRSGASVPCDAVVTEGSCTVDESALTGESLPADKETGSRLMSASVVTGGYV